MKQILFLLLIALPLITSCQKGEPEVKILYATDSTQYVPVKEFKIFKFVEPGIYSQNEKIEPVYTKTLLVKQSDSETVSILAKDSTYYLDKGYSVIGDYEMIEVDGAKSINGYHLKNMESVLSPANKVDRVDTKNFMRHWLNLNDHKDRTTVDLLSEGLFSMLLSTFGESGNTEKSNIDSRTETQYEYVGLNGYFQDHVADSKNSRYKSGYGRTGKENSDYREFSCNSLSSQNIVDDRIFEYIYYPYCIISENDWMTTSDIRGENNKYLKYLPLTLLTGKGYAPLKYYPNLQSGVKSEDVTTAYFTPSTKDNSQMYEIVHLVSANMESGDLLTSEGFANNTIDIYSLSQLTYWLHDEDNNIVYQIKPFKLGGTTNAGYDVSVLCLNDAVDVYFYEIMHPDGIGGLCTSLLMRVILPANEHKFRQQVDLGRLLSGEHLNYRGRIWYKNRKE
jgi:hypothetical protein